MPEFNKVVWSDMTDKQRDAVTMFEKGEFMYGEQKFKINTLNDLHKANDWVLWQCRDDYRLGVVAAIQNTFIIPMFQAHVLRIVRSTRPQDRIKAYDNGD